ncbi:MAG: ATPase [Candidatus Nealsonbacteria bacterium]|nr:ATPase [Candidatus Nealsonbacteria bacterium]
MSSTEKDSKIALVIAIPVVGGRLCMHFGHCEQFVLLDVDTAGKEILNSRNIDPPPHEPGLLPRWLHDQGVNLVIAGGMGGRAQGIFADSGIEVIVGAPAEPPESIVRSYLDGKLQPGENICDH